MKQILVTKAPLIIDVTRPNFLATFLNPYSYSLARADEKLFSRFDYVAADGALFVRQLRLLGVKTVRQSFDMTSLAGDVFRHAQATNKTIALIGAAMGVAQRAAKILNDEYGGLSFTVVNDGFFPSDLERDQLIAKLCAARPDIVIVGMGTPLQERFLVDLWDAGWRGQGYTCGGFLHQTAKRGVKYYPETIDRMNLRWLYRIYDEPKLMKRYFYSYPVAVTQFLADIVPDRAKRK